MPSDLDHDDNHLLDTPLHDPEKWHVDHRNSCRFPSLLRKPIIAIMTALTIPSPTASSLVNRLANLFAMPSFDTPEKLQPTAYLDGLRGFAAFLVYWHHHELWSHGLMRDAIFERGYGFDGQHYFTALPFVRNFFGGGHYAVATFFVISGYVLSVKPMRLIHAGEQEKLADNLASALFRRWLRLFMPLIATTFLFMTSWHAFGIWVDSAKPQSNYRDEFWWWYAEVKNFSFIYHLGGEPWLSYNFHLWSIPVEFKGSMVIYTSLLAFSRATRKARLWCQVFLIFYFIYIVDGTHYALFSAGMLLNDLDLLAMKDELPNWLAQLEPFNKHIFYSLFVVSFYLGGVPVHTKDINDLAKTPGWYFLSFLKPQAVYDYKWFYLFWAGVFLVVSVPRIPLLKRFFETRFCQYLGRISFALYLVHGPILWTIGDRIYTAVGWGREPQLTMLANWVNKFPLPMAGPFGLETAFLLPHIVLLPLTLYVAEISTRLFDEPSVTFPNWLYKKVLGGGGQPGGTRLP